MPAVSPDTLPSPIAPSVPPSPAPATLAFGFMAKPTPQLRAVLEQQKSLLSPDDFAGLIAGVRGAFEKYTAKLRQFPRGIERAQVLHHLMDRELQAAANQPVSCCAGCSGCCHYEVEITQDEAAVLAALVEDGFPIDRARLDEQASRERRSPLWSRFWHPESRCVFLGATGSCQIYEHRPAICRKHLVVSPASACTTAGATVVPVQVLMAEILLSAAISIEDTPFAALPKMLHAALHADAEQLASSVPMD